LLTTINTNQFPAEKTGIYLLSYGESVDILRIASQDTVFNSIKLYGCSGFAGINTLPLDTIAATFAENETPLKSYSIYMLLFF